MAKFGLQFLTFLLSLAIGILLGSFKFDQTQGQTFNFAVNPVTPIEYYDFFAANHPSRSASTAAFQPKIDPGEPRKTFCSDPKIKPIWQLIRRDREVREALDFVWSPIDSADCKDMFELKYFDLNRDGRKEILVRGGGFPLCGAVGNCDFWVIERKPKGLRVLLHGDDEIDLTDLGKEVLKTRTNGYADLLLKGHFSASETSYSTYKFNGRKYVETQCRYHVPTNNIKTGPEWEFISCEEFYGRLNK